MAGDMRKVEMLEAVVRTDGKGNYAVFLPQLEFLITADSDGTPLRSRAQAEKVAREALSLCARTMEEHGAIAGPVFCIEHGEEKKVN